MPMRGTDGSKNSTGSSLEFFLDFLGPLVFFVFFFFLSILVPSELYFCAFGPRVFDFFCFLGNGC